jgi:hypothetical protein
VISRLSAARNEKAGAGTRPPNLGYEAGGVVIPIRQTQR